MFLIEGCVRYSSIWILTSVPWEQWPNSEHQQSCVLLCMRPPGEMFFFFQVHFKNAHPVKTALPFATIHFLNCWATAFLRRAPTERTLSHHSLIHSATVHREWLRVSCLLIGSLTCCCRCCYCCYRSSREKPEKWGCKTTHTTHTYLILKTINTFSYRSRLKIKHRRRSKCGAFV